MKVPLNRVDGNVNKDSINATFPIIKKFQARLQKFLEPRIKGARKLAENAIGDI